MARITVTDLDLPEEGRSPSQTAGRLHVVLDEAFDPFTAVCAVVFTEDEYLTANRQISALRTDVESSTYLAGNKSYKRFIQVGFHATNDTPEISTPFVDETFKRLPGRAFIYYTDGERRRDLSPKKTCLLLYACVLQVILLRHREAREITLHFEQHHDLQRFFPQVAELAVRRSRSKATVTVETCAKGEPACLALADYILHIFGQSIEFSSHGLQPTESYKYRNLKAIKNHVSLIYSMERGRVASRSVSW